MRWISKNRSLYWFDCKCFSMINTEHKIIFDIFFIYFLFHHLSFWKTDTKTKLSLFLLTLKGFILSIQGIISVMVIILSAECFLFIYMYISKLKANKLFEYIDADLFCKKADLCINKTKITVLTFLLHRYSFYRINNRQLLKTLWKKKKLLVTGNFFFSHNVFYSIRKLYPQLSIFLTSYLYLLLNWKSSKLACEVKGEIV